MNAALSRRTELQTRIHDLRNWSGSELIKAVHASYPSKAEQLRERPEDRAARADEHQAEPAKLEKTITDVKQG
ncbi:MAG: hypothetical protein ACQESR_03055 [Planctomycetota bacterium]